MFAHVSVYLRVIYGGVWYTGMEWDLAGLFGHGSTHVRIASTAEKYGVKTVCKLCLLLGQALRREGTQRTTGAAHPLPLDTCMAMVMTVKTCRHHINEGWAGFEANSKDDHKLSWSVI